MRREILTTYLPLTEGVRLAFGILLYIGAYSHESNYNYSSRQFSSQIKYKDRVTALILISALS